MIQETDMVERSGTDGAADARAVFEAAALEDQAAADGGADTRLGRLGELAARQLALEDQAEELEERLKEKRAELARVAEQDIPTLMEEIGLSEVRTRDGARVTVKDSLKVSTAGKWREPINRWLTETDNDDLIKDEVKVVFGKGEGDDAHALVEHIESGLRRVAERKRYVAQPTLAALIREMLEAGDDVPLDRLGAFVLKRAKIVRPEA